MTDIATRRIEANGLTFAIDEIGEGDDVILLLHGFPESRAAWRALAPDLAKLGWRVVVPDLRGYGDSSRPSNKDAYLLANLAADVEGLFDALGARRRLLVGHDWGGVVAWETARRARAKLDGLVIINAPHPLIYARLLRRSWSQQRKSLYVALFLAPWLPEYLLTMSHGRIVSRALKSHTSAVPKALRDLYRANIAQPGAATAMLNYYRANISTLGQSFRGSMIETPTLMIWGDDDKALDIAVTQGHDEFVRDFTLRRLPGASHFVMHDAPQRVVDLIADWARRKGLAET